MWAGDFEPAQATSLGRGRQVLLKSTTVEPYELRQDAQASLWSTIVFRGRVAVGLCLLSQRLRGSDVDPNTTIVSRSQHSAKPVFAIRFS